MKIKLHPLFLVLAVVLIFCRQGLVLVYSVVSVILHELGHYVMCKYFGYTLNEIRLMPYGAMLYGEEKLDSKAESYISIAGPLVSLLLALIFISFWWIIPSSYYYTKELVYINLNLFLVNLLPCYPLDGARLILSLSKDKLKSLKRLRITGVIFSFLFMILFIVSIFFTVNFTIMVFSIFLFIGATSKADKQKDNYFFNTSFFIKQLKNGVTDTTIYVSNDVNLLRLVRLLNPNNLTTFIVVDNNFNKLFTINEKDIKSLVVSYSLTTKISDIKF